LQLSFTEIINVHAYVQPKKKWGRRRNSNNKYNSER